MREADDPRLSLQVGGKTVGERLDAAIARGMVVRTADGRLSSRARLATTPAGVRVGPDTSIAVESEASAGYMYRYAAELPPCRFLNRFLFNQAYGRSTPPFGCRNCYKIKASTKSLRALMAMKEVAEATDFTTKSGAQVDDPMNSDVYATYIYFTGLEEARETYLHLRSRVNEHPQLGPSVAMTIRRGCSNYEHACGPPDRYTFDPRLEAVEDHLAGRFVHETPPKPHSRETVNAMRLMYLVRVAYRIGDETYKDFTGGKPLYPPFMNYAPDETPPVGGA